MIEYAYFETTNYCNLDCSFCNRKDVIGPLQHMKVERFDLLLSKLKGQPIKEAKLMGMGEPLLHPNFDEICKTFKTHFPEAKLVVATNCQYRMTSVFTECLKYVDLMYFSIDGWEANYERDRPPAKWNKLINFLEDFKEVDRYGCINTVNYVVNPDNVYDIWKVFKHIVMKYDLAELRLNIVQDWTEGQTATAGYTSKQMDYLREWKPNIKGKSEWDFDKCFWPKTGIYTTVEGDVKMCALNTSTVPFGNLFEEDLNSIHNGAFWTDVARGCRLNEPTSHCVNCSYKQLIPILKSLGVNNDD